MSADYARKLVDAVSVYDNTQKRYNCTDPDVVVKLPKTESVSQSEKVFASDRNPVSDLNAVDGRDDLRQLLTPL